MAGFDRFIGIDWSGAKGRRLDSLAIAKCEDGLVTLVTPFQPRQRWSRDAILNYLEMESYWLERRAMVGIDSAFSMPFVDKGLYLPELRKIGTALELWDQVEDACHPADKGLYAGGFVEKHSDYYLRPGKRGKQFERRMRVAEQLCVDSGAGPCESVFHLIGPSQVGLSGLSTVRMLKKLRACGEIAVWPFDEPENEPLVVVEIYAAMFTKMAGFRGKLRSVEDVATAVSNLGAMLDPSLDEINDHQADALVTAAGLAAIADKSEYWNPPSLSPMVRESEGWIFGLKA